MMSFIRAHGYDPGPTQRPLAAGAIAGVLACVPAAAVLVGFGSFEVAAESVLRAPRAAAGGLTLAAFMVGGLVYGAFFRRAANDPRAGWMLGLGYGFLQWIAAPVIVLPLVRGSTMAAGTAAIGFLAAFLVWGLAIGLAFPPVHRSLQGRLDGSGGSRLRFGPDQASLKRRLLHRPL